MRRFAARFACAGFVVVLSLAAFALPADASVCTRDVPSAAALSGLIGKLSQKPDCAPGGANGQVEVYVTGSKGSVGFYAYPASKARIVQSQIEGEFNGRLHEKHLAALGTNGAVWSYHGAPADAWFTRGGQFVWIDGTLTGSKDVIRLAKKIYAKIG
jgi:CubicO group peptidase (beta-lactamase class C family)